MILFIYFLFVNPNMLPSDPSLYWMVTTTNPFLTRSATPYWEPEPLRNPPPWIQKITGYLLLLVELCGI